MGQQGKSALVWWWAPVTKPLAAADSTRTHRKNFVTTKAYYLKGVCPPGPSPCGSRVQQSEFADLAGRAAFMQ
jgi:hypothetical protein